MISRETMGLAAGALALLGLALVALVSVTWGDEVRTWLWAALS